ncbi:prenyltransferase/squalene oxidase repeat-containing protein [Geosporobacter ferrireducens]|uniref:Squalene cyclase N-terminal domain-containing protein n=1 Tax=Geosporobacter ferrireducens TaxID=1424294 RepID=A0A1D8GGA4_9FIRM|nr:prenyltransferase/squalene oxidase repeat-containing protein [Geosporobacter ferrireducens]AOT69929.1 hypothetical protein Gferi_10245 [Geosporobacter ferrireducens]MTI54375.1 hypothetical protein [Geosporobacter ferrireducens]
MRRVLIVAMALILMMGNVSYGLDLGGAVSYLEKQKVDHWGILALHAYGRDLKGKSLEKVNSDMTTDYESYILGALALGQDADAVAKKVAGAQRKSGKFADAIDGTGEDNVGAHVWGIISLYTAGYDSYNRDRALKWLKDNQNADGGFAIFTGDKNSDLDMTAMALVAYSALGLDSKSDEVKKAVDYLEKNLGKRESCEAYAWYILARKKLGLDINKTLYNKLLEYRLKDGSFKHLKSINKTNYMATWHGVLALADYQNEASIFDRLRKGKTSSDQKPAVTPIRK